ncbi:hypothetical protein Tco_1290763 [Tanacetum coccineum]
MSNSMLLLHLLDENINMQRLADNSVFSLLKLKNKKKVQLKQVVKIISRSLDGDMNLQLSKGADREVFPLTKEDLSNLGTNEVLLKGLSIGDTDLDEKFYLFKNETYKDISLTKVKDIPKDEKGTTLILSEHLRFYHCNLLFTPPPPPPRSNLGRYMLHYVEDANALKKQPWVSLAITTLKEGGYDDKKRDVRFIGDARFVLS